MRINRYLALCGVGSRRCCDALIDAGRVRVNGAVANLGARVGDADRVEVDGRTVTPPADTGVWLLHKPAGTVCTATDPEQRSTVLDLARQAGLEMRLFPVGRLDRDTTGLLLLTTDGDLCHRLTHPSWGVDKEYLASISSPLAAAELQQLRSGVELDDGRTSPCEVDQRTEPGGTIVRLVLHEGRKRQVRRMLAAVGHPVLQLHRVRVGPIQLGSLPEGELRALTPQERRLLGEHSGDARAS